VGGGKKRGRLEGGGGGGGEHVVHMEERKGRYRVLVGKPEGKRPFGGRGVDGGIILK